MHVRHHLGGRWFPRLRRTPLSHGAGGCRPQGLETVPAPNCLRLGRRGKTPPNATLWRTTVPKPRWPNWPCPTIRPSTAPRGQATTDATGLHGAGKDRWGGLAPRLKSTTCVKPWPTTRRQCMCGLQPPTPGRRFGTSHPWSTHRRPPPPSSHSGWACPRSKPPTHACAPPARTPSASACALT